MISRIERRFDVGLGERTLLPSGGFSLRISGHLVPAVSGKHWLGFLGGGATRFYLDGRLLFDSGHARAAVQGPSSAGERQTRLLAEAVELEAGRAYELRVEHVTDFPRARMSLVWLPPRPADAVDGRRGEGEGGRRHRRLRRALAGAGGRGAGRDHAPGFRGGDRTDIAPAGGAGALLGPWAPPASRWSWSC